MQIKIQKLAVILLVLTSLYSIVLHWCSTIGIDKGSEALDTWEDHLQPVRDALPIKRGVIGFVGEWDVPGIESAFMDQESEYLLTQYALAPLILVRGAVAEWNIAILNRGAFAIWEQSNQGKFEVIPFKHNIYLLHREAGK